MSKESLIMDGIESSGSEEQDLEGIDSSSDAESNESFNQRAYSNYTYTFHTKLNQYKSNVMALLKQKQVIY